MSFFSVNESPKAVSQISMQQEDSAPSFSMPTSLPLRPRPGSDRMPFVCSLPGCLECFETEWDRDTHEADIHSTAVMMSKRRQSGASEDDVTRLAKTDPTLLEYNHQLMLLEVQNRKRPGLPRTLLEGNDLSPPSQTSMSAYHTQLSLLEEQNQQRLAMARTPVPASNDKFPPAIWGASALQDYELQLMLLEQQNKRRMLIAREEQATRCISKESYKPNPDEQECKPCTWSDTITTHAMRQQTHLEPTPPTTLSFLPSHNMPVLPESHFCCRDASTTISDNQSPKCHTGPSHQLWLSGPHALQDYETQRQLVEQHKAQDEPTSQNHTLQDYQLQLMLMQQNKKRKLLQDAAMARAKDEQAKKLRKPCTEIRYAKPQVTAEHTNSDIPAQKRAAEILARPDNHKKHVRQTPPAALDPKRIVSAEQIACQRQLVIQQHQANLKYWQSKQQLKQQEATNKALQGNEQSTTFSPSQYFACMPGQTAMDAASRRQPTDITSLGWVPSSQNNLSDCEVLGATSCTGKPTTAPKSSNLGMHSVDAGSAREEHIMDLPIRQSKKVEADEQIASEMEMEGWSAVEKPQERACSEESEQFSVSEGFGAVDT